MIRKNWILFLVLLTSNLCLGQETDIDWEFKDQPLIEVLKEIESAHSLLFSYKNENLDQLIINCKIEADDIYEGLDLLLKDTPLFYTVSGDKFVLLNTSQEIQIEGRVLSQATGEPLAFANVYVESGKGTSTDQEGRFKLDLSYAKNAQLVISYLSFESQYIPIDHWKSRSTPDIKLKTATSNFNNFLVIKDYITDGIELTDNGSSTKLKPRFIGSLAGQVNPEVLALAKILPGISAPGSKASDVRIRGCTPDQNLLIWEDIPIYHSAHYFGMISAINPFTIEEIDTYRGGFGAEYGGRIGGVIDMKSSDEKSLKSYYGVGANMTHAFVYGNHKFSDTRPSVINFSLRRSYSELLRTPTFNNIAKLNQQGLLIGNKELQSLPDNIMVEDKFNFLDGQFKFSSQLSKNDHLSMAVLYAQNSFSDRISDDNRKESQTDSMYLDNIGLSASWVHNWSKNNTTVLKVVSSQYGYDYNYSLSPFGSTQSSVSGIKENAIKDQQITLVSKNNLGKHQYIESAYQFINYDIFYKVEELSENSRDIIESAQTSSGLHTLYAIFKNPISNVIGVNAGLRSSYYLENKKLYFEPRLRLSSSLSTNLSLHANFGRHYQFVSQLQGFRGNESGISSSLWALSEERSVPVQKSDLYQLGMIYKKPSWLVDIQFYRRNIFDLSTRSFKILTTTEILPSIGDGRIMGLDLLLKKRFGKFKSWLSYSFSKSEYLFPELEVDYFIADESQRNIFKWGNQFSYKAFDFSAAFKYASGLPYSAITRIEVINQPIGPPILAPQYDGINKYFLGSQQELNLAVQYKMIRKKAFKVFIDFSITNVLNRENLSSREYYIDIPIGQIPVIDFVDRASLPFTPNLGFRIEW